MLFNTAWNKTPEVKPMDEMLSTASLIAWLEKKPADESYTYRKGDSCLLAQYFHENGEQNVTLGHEHIYPGLMRKSVPLPPAFQSAAGRWSGDHTFGAALKRLKAFA